MYLHLHLSTMQNSRNVLVATDAASDAGTTAKIADLGISKAIAQHKTHRTTTNLGTITHSAPELLRSGRMSPHVDVYR
jgi:serine/threonine protein kinase